ncbi:MAG: sigma-70 family RNA polymerase sigma factor [Planctomycetes bacterium]|nr:sigma-70 family RNA polymerase sigma factor [Planctomycetota bacterium]
MAVALTETPLRRWLLRQGIQSSDREDLLEEVYVEGWRSLRKLRDPAAFKAWIWRICRATVHRWRVRAQWEAAFLSLLPFDLLDVAPAPAPGGEAAPLSLGAFAELAPELSPEDRLVLWRRFGERLRLREISALTGFSMGHVHRQIDGARERLGRALRRRGLA